MEIEHKKNKITKVKNSFHTICSYLDIKSLVTLRETSSEIKNLVDSRIAKLLLISPSFSPISYKLQNLAIKPQKNSDYMKLYSELSNSKIRSKIQKSDLKCSYASSIDYSQTPENLFNEDPTLFWGSKGHDNPNNSELINFCHKNGLLLNIKSLEIEFYREDTFEDGFNFFPSNEILIRVGLFEHKFDHEYGPFSVKDGMIEGEDKIKIELKGNNFLAKFFQIEFKGKPGMQKQDKKYYHAVKSLDLEGHQFDIKEGAEEILNVLEAYYEKREFIKSTVSEFYKVTFPTLYSKILKEKIEKLELKDFILGRGEEIINKLHLPAIKGMIREKYSFEVIFEYVNKSFGIKEDLRCMEFLKDKEVISEYLEWVLPRYGVLNQVESRMVVFRYFYTRLHEEFGEEKGVDKERFNQLVRIFFFGILIGLIHFFYLII